ncbi:serine protease inhibitor 42Dd [Drosophila mojavensis]|uniref:Serpin domain-containing protein n=1 Tax=Drosophila mojavensis TaxID=7230 RepID=A0A0Q9XBZ3_DROMO|nr:serine protease inhibitor 42Dd [Drosophila mojavensis]KRG01831.1 uncharacterized protein Dmoj_GI26680 [Drosophila mojavensis]
MADAEGSISFFSALSTFSGKLVSKLFIMNPGKNLIFSPLSIHSCLGMIRLGADEGTTTAKELDKGIGFTSSDESEIAEDFHIALEPYQDDTMLNMAYKMYVMQEFEIRPEFHEILTEKFHSEPENVDFSENTVAAEKINEWIETKMNHLIKDQVSPDILNETTGLVLISAAHFKAEWSIGFSARATRREFFHIDPKNKIRVLMMNNFHEYDYADLKQFDAKALRLNFSNTPLQMIIILPNKTFGLETLIEALSTTSLENIISLLTRKRVYLKLPKFTAEFEQDLTPVFPEFGVKRIFMNKAELGKISETNRVIKVSSVLHKASIELSEAGDEVLPLPELKPTMVKGKIRKPPSPVNFYADHPFYYAIYDAVHGPLVVGSLQAPLPAPCINNPLKPCYCERS